MLKEDEIKQRGIIRDVVSTLGDGDERVPSGHWANHTGTRVYSLNRVEIAESLIDSCENGIYYHNKADELNKMKLPVTPPYIVVNHLKIACKLWELFENKDRPFLGHLFIEQFITKLRPLIVIDLTYMIKYAYPNSNVSNETEVLNFLDDIAESAIKLFPEPWPNAIARKQEIKKNIYSGTSPLAAMKLLKVFSLIRANKISTEHLTIFKNRNDIFELLALNKTIRIDPVICKK